MIFALLHMAAGGSRRTLRPNTALLTDAFHSALRATRGAAKRER
jgi:hypothetical protein